MPNVKLDDTLSNSAVTLNIANILAKASNDLLASNVIGHMPQIWKTAQFILNAFIVATFWVWARFSCIHNTIAVNLLNGDFPIISVFIGSSSSIESPFDCSH